MIPEIAGALVSGGLNLVGDMVSETNARSAFKSRYQDTVADMRKAGLNPALAYGQGGGNPQTSDFGDIGSAALSGAQNAASAKAAAAQSHLTTSQANLLDRQADDLALTTAYRRAQAGFDQSTADSRARIAAINSSNKQDLNADYVRGYKARQELLRLQLPSARAYAKYYEGPIGKAEPYSENARQWVGTAIDAAKAAKGGGNRTTNIYPRR